MRSHLYIPDTQCGPKRPTLHLGWARACMANYNPEVVIQGGDLGDFASVSKYGTGQLVAEGRRLSKDWDAFRYAAEILTPEHKCRLVWTEGNHEYRLNRYRQQHPENDMLPDCRAFMKSLGWEVYPYMSVVRIDGVAYSHLFARNSQGRVTQGSERIGATSARLQVLANGESCTAGHRQGLEWSVVPVGKHLHHGLIAGSFYLHDEGYLTPQGNTYWRGIVYKQDVKNGQYTPEFLDMEYLRRHYG